MSLVSDAHRRANGETIDPERGSRAMASLTALFGLVLAMALGSAATVLLGGQVFTPHNDAVLENIQVPSTDDSLSSSDPVSPHNDGLNAAQPLESSATIIALYDRARAERASVQQASSTQVTPSSQQGVSDMAGQSFDLGGAPPDQADSTPTSIDEARVLARAQRLLASSQRDATLSSALPTLEALSKDARDDVPTLLYSVHDYRAEGGSKVMINRQWWAEGQKISGITLIEIREKSAVFETVDGTRFLQPALSSWVNL